jgi:hypothetical protein
MLYSKELVSDVNRCHFHPVGYDVPELFVKEIQDFSDYSFRIFKLFYSELTSKQSTLVRCFRNFDIDGKLCCLATELNLLPMLIS